MKLHYLNQNKGVNLKGSEDSAIKASNTKTHSENQTNMSINTGLSEDIDNNTLYKQATMNDRNNCT